jgi:hypothetical protein
MMEPSAIDAELVILSVSVIAVGQQVNQEADRPEPSLWSG